MTLIIISYEWLKKIYLIAIFIGFNRLFCAKPAVNRFRKPKMTVKNKTKRKFETSISIKFKPNKKRTKIKTIKLVIFNRILKTSLVLLQVIVLTYSVVWSLSD